ncbi:MAG: efflux RND transporter periplasmic adaptor subunit [Gammaproteobacteria bacterium]
MHPEITSNEPGACPICGMDLIEHPHAHSLSETRSELQAVSVSPTVAHNLGVRTAKAIRGDLQHHIETIGKITRIDPTARKIITPPVSGILSYLVDKYDGDEVDKGDLLFSVSSEYLLDQQRIFQELHAAGKTSEASEMIPLLIRSGLTSEQISKLRSGSPPDFTADVYADEPGFVFSRRGEIGDSVSTGFTVFNIGSDYRVVEVTVEIFERQWGWVAENQPAKMTVRGLPGVVFEGTVVRVEPPVGYTTRSLEAALKFKTNHPGLSQSLFAHISIAGQIRHNVLTVPRDSVIRTERQDRIVLLKEDGRYQPVAVQVGEEFGGMMEIVSGLNEGDTVVSSGQFLIDSESSLQSALLRMSSPEPELVRETDRDLVSHD